MMIRVCLVFIILMQFVFSGIHCDEGKEGLIGENQPTIQFDEVLENEPGMDKDVKIVGGRAAAKGEFPFMVGIYRARTNRPFCGGSLVDNRWVMTAAHCVSNRRAQLKVVVGDHNVKDNDGSEQHIGVCSVHVHPRYSSTQGANNDIALLKLCRPVVSSKFVAKIPLPNSGIELKDREHVRVAGWGLTREKGRTSSVLRVVDVNVVSIGLCRKAYGFLADDNKICAGNYKYGGKDSCQGDSGGPLWWVNGKKIELVGVVSTGRGCARPYYPGIYTKVSSYLDWVNKVMRRY